MDSGVTDADGDVTEDDWFEEAKIWRPQRPSRFQLGLAVVNLIIPCLILGWAGINGHEVFFEWQTLGGLGLLFALGADTFYIYWLTSTDDPYTTSV